MKSSSAPTRVRTRGPVELVLEVGMGLFFVTVFSCFVGLLIEVIGSYTWWKGQESAAHAKAMVQQDLEYIAEAPRSLLIPDTVAFSQDIVMWVEWPYRKLGIIDRQEPQAQDTIPTTGASQTFSSNIKRTSKVVAKDVAMVAKTSMYVIQDVLLRMSVAAFALPAFVLACLVGVVDGLVRRDLRRWSGGRESSFVYHHAKRYTLWALTGGLGLYLAWPFGGFNPSYMVLVFTVLVAFTMSTTVAAFKKYV